MGIVDVDAPQPFIISSIQITPFADLKRPERVLAIERRVLPSAFFVLWLAGVLRTLALDLPVTLLHEQNLKSRDCSTFEATDAIVLNEPDLDSLADDWDCFCAGDESWLVGTLAIESNGHAPFPWAATVASIVSCVRGSNNTHSLDQTILYQLSETSWTTLAVIVGEVYSRIDAFGELILLRRIRELSEVSSPALIDIRVDATAKTTRFTAISARLTAAGAAIRGDRITLGRITPPLWIGGFDARC